MILFSDVMKSVERKTCLVDNFVIRTVNSGVLTLTSSVCVGFTLPASVGNADVDVIRVLDVCVVTTVFPKVKDSEAPTLIAPVGSDAVDKFVVCVTTTVDDVISFASRVVTFTVSGGPMEEVEL